MRRGVDARGEARDDDDALADELRGDVGGERATGVGSSAGADDRDAGAVKEADVAGHVEGAHAGQGHRRPAGTAKGRFRVVGTDWVFMRDYIRKSIAFDNPYLIARVSICVLELNSSHDRKACGSVPSNAREARAAGRGLRPLCGRRPGPTREGTAPRSGAGPRAARARSAPPAAARRNKRGSCGSGTREPEGPRALRARGLRRGARGGQARPAGAPARAAHCHRDAEVL